MGVTPYCSAMMTLGTGPVWLLRKKAALVDAYSAHKHDPGSHIPSQPTWERTRWAIAPSLVSQAGGDPFDPSSNSKLSPSRPKKRTVEPCALRLALPRWSAAPYFQHPCHRIILQITAPWSHLGQPISGKYLHKVLFPTPLMQAARYLQASMFCASDHMFFGFSQGSYTHLSKVIFLRAVVEICKHSGPAFRDPWFLQGLQKKRATHDPQIAQIAQSNTIQAPG